MALTSQWSFKNKRKKSKRPAGDGPVFIHALDGFLSAGHAPELAAGIMVTREDVVHEFDLDAIYDYRARRPPITFRGDHYTDYEAPRLTISRERDKRGNEFLLLAGPEPDFGWQRFVDEVIDVLNDHGVSLTVGLGSVPMGVPHTRPAVITAHASRPELIDRPNLWNADVTVPSSAQSLLEYTMGQRGLDAIGYVVHVPHYVAQHDFPPATIALFDALSVRTGLEFDTEELRAIVPEALADIERQIVEQGGEEVLTALENQYDAFTRGAAKSLLEDDTSLPSGDELAAQLESFLARQRKDGD